MSKQFNTRIQHKIDTYENWSKAENFIPLLGELIIYTTNEKGEAETKIKIGDGTTNVNDLEFAVAGSTSGETEFAQSDWAQADTTQLDYIKNKPGDKITTTTSELLVEADFETSGSENIIPGAYVWNFEINENVKYKNGDKIKLTILPDNIVLESILYTDEIADNAFGVGANTDGNYATFNLTSGNILTAYSDNFQKKDTSIPYGIGINLLSAKPGYSVVSPPLFVVSKENDLQNKIILFEIIKEEIQYVKLSNEALNFDEIPIENSDNLITSGTIYNYFSNLPKIQFITWEEND